VTKRNPAAVVLFTILTFGLYAYYWLYATSAELKQETGRRDISPLLDAFLAFMTAGVWGVWAGYRNARIAHELQTGRGLAHTDRSLVIGAAGAASFFFGPWTWLVAMALSQEDFNKVAEPIDYFASEHDFKARAKPRVRVETEPARKVRVAPMEEDFEPMEVRRRPRANDVEVFISNAPAPNAY
jgi:hypothetical protein